MSKFLSKEQIATYQNDGLVFPIKVMPEIEAAELQRRLEQYERDNGGPIQKEWRHKVHLLFTWANEIIRNPSVSLQQLPGVITTHSLFRLISTASCWYFGRISSADTAVWLK